MEFEEFEKIILEAYEDYKWHRQAENIIQKSYVHKQYKNNEEYEISLEKKLRSDKELTKEDVEEFIGNIDSFDFEKFHDRYELNENFYINGYARINPHIEEKSPDESLEKYDYKEIYIDFITKFQEEFESIKKDPTGYIKTKKLGLDQKNVFYHSLEKVRQGFHVIKSVIENYHTKRLQGLFQESPITETYFLNDKKNRERQNNNSEPKENKDHIRLAYAWIPRSRKKKELGTELGKIKFEIDFEKDYSVRALYRILIYLQKEAKSNVENYGKEDIESLPNYLQEYDELESAKRKFHSYLSNKPQIQKSFLEKHCPELELKLNEANSAVEEELEITTKKINELRETLLDIYGIEEAYFAGYSKGNIMWGCDDDTPGYVKFVHSEKISDYVDERLVESAVKFMENYHQRVLDWDM